MRQNMRKPRIRFYFAIYSDTLAPEVITGRLGVEPTTVSHKGEIWWRRTGKVYPQHVWRLSSEFEESLDIDSQIAAVLPKLIPVKSELVEILRENETVGVFQAVIETYDGSTPALHLDQELVSFAGDLGVEFDFDLYTFNSEDG